MATSDRMKVAEQAKEDLDSLIGLKSVKTKVNELVSLAIDAKRRSALDPVLPTDSMSHHLIFTGNPGTGKTTVADSLGRAYYGLGLIEKPDVTAVKKQDLVGQYLGETEQKTAAVWAKAKGGVLFVDEAYRLMGDSYGQTAMDQLMELMENDRSDTVVIMAGYPKEMNELLKTNPGLRSRFPRKVAFPDYSPKEREQIMSLMFDKGEYTLDDDAAEVAREAADYLPAQGNARSVRNFVESVRRAQAVRLAVEFPAGEDVPRESLQEITSEDVTRGWADYMENSPEYTDQDESVDDGKRSGTYAKQRK